MPAPLDAGMPPDTVIGDGYTVRFTALDPTTGAVVSGVVVSEANVTGEDLSGGGGASDLGPFMLVPGPGA